VPDTNLSLPQALKASFFLKSAFQAQIKGGI
jgi:hypothetical protein